MGRNERCLPNSLKDTKEQGSRRRDIIILPEKKDGGKRYNKNWRPMSLLNVDTKMISKVFTEKLKETLSSIISENQTVNVKNRCILWSGRLIADIIDVFDKEKSLGNLVTMYIEKAFDSLDYDFPTSVLRKFGLGYNFIKWVKVLWNNQESYVF